ncbi:hypothetical protein OTU49_011430 [Cherax quadricarinatus]|uniref:Uncharacterized protein n=1 Tax=Cherax quadricarinatus TaxID=27406 RepID=A0AAW0W643_CHEQU
MDVPRNPDGVHSLPQVEERKYRKEYIPCIFPFNSKPIITDEIGRSPPKTELPPLSTSPEDVKGPSPVKQEVKGPSPVKPEAKGPLPVQQEVKGPSPVKPEAKGPLPVKQEVKGPSPVKQVMKAPPSIVQSRVFNKTQYVDKGVPSCTPW